MRDLSRLMRSDTEQLGFSLQLKDDDALDEWNINLFGFSDCPLAEVGTVFGGASGSACEYSVDLRPRFRGVASCFTSRRVAGYLFCLEGILMLRRTLRFRRDPRVDERCALRSAWNGASHVFPGVVKI